MAVGGSCSFGMGLSRDGLHGKTRLLTLGKRSSVRVACYVEIRAQSLPLAMIPQTVQQAGIAPDVMMMVVTPG
jgi:hypothetical protein